MPDIVRLRFLGEQPQHVPKLGYRRVVQPDELVGIPRELYEAYAWPTSVWLNEDDPAAAGDRDFHGGPPAPRDEPVDEPADERAAPPGEQRVDEPAAAPPAAARRSSGKRGGVA